MLPACLLYLWRTRNVPIRGNVAKAMATRAREERKSERESERASTSCRKMNATIDKLRMASIQCKRCYSVLLCIVLLSTNASYE